MKKKAIIFGVIAAISLFASIVSGLFLKSTDDGADVFGAIFWAVIAVIFTVLSVCFTVKHLKGTGFSVKFRKANKDFVRGKQRKKTNVIENNNTLSAVNEDYLWIKAFIYEKYIEKNKDFSYDKMLNVIKIDATMGNARAKAIMGTLYYNGYPEAGIVKNVFAAFNYYKSAAADGDCVAECFLGNFYESGECVAKNGYTAFTLYQRSSAKGFPLAHFAVGNCFFEGIGVSVDYAQAIKWYKKAIDNKAYMACVNLGLAYLKIGDKINGKHYLEIAAKRGNAQAKINLEREFGIKL